MAPPVHPPGADCLGCNAARETLERAQVAAHGTTARGELAARHIPGGGGSLDADAAADMDVEDATEWGDEPFGNR
jgi:hypothetical protein